MINIDVGVYLMVCQDECLVPDGIYKIIAGRLPS